MSDINNLSNKFISHLLGMDKRIYAYDMLKTPLRPNEELPAYVVTKDRIAIPGFSIPEFEHEIAHFVEMNNFQRLLLPDFGMESFVGNKEPRGAKLFAAVSREIRVRTIAVIIKDRFSNPPYSFTESIINHPAWGDWMKQSLPFGKFDIFPNTGCLKLLDTPDKESNKLVQWIETLYQTTLKKWNLQRIEHEWKVRLEFIQNWMETT